MLFFVTLFKKIKEEVPKNIKQHISFKADNKSAY